MFRLQKRLRNGCSMNEQKSSLDGTQKIWAQPVYVKTAQNLISRMDDKRSKVFNAHQGKFGSYCLNVIPCKNLVLKLDDQQLRISIDLRLDVPLMVKEWYKSAGRFSRHATLNFFKKQTLGSLDLPSMLERVVLNCSILYRTDDERPDGVTMNPWKMGMQLVSGVTVVDAHAPSRLNQGSLSNGGTTGTEAEARKIDKYRKLTHKEYFFQPVAMKYRVLLARAVKFSSRVPVKCCRSHDNRRAGSFSKQWISLALPIGSAEIF